MTTDEMASNFMAWKLPRDFYPDAGISFNPSEPLNPDSPSWPTGTNLLSHEQAKAMFEWVLGQSK